MTNTTTNNSYTQSLIGESVSPEYLHQEIEAELLAADAEGGEFEGYAEYSLELEAGAWQGAQTVGDVLIKKACEHTTCSHFACSRNLRMGGIEICAPNSRPQPKQPRCKLESSGADRSPKGLTHAATSSPKTNAQMVFRPLTNQSFCDTPTRSCLTADTWS